MSVKQNFAYNLINTVLKIVFPLLLFPYITRTLLPEGIGKLNYAEALVNYFVLFASMGIPVYGIREVARYKENRVELKTNLVQIFSINLVFMIASAATLSIFIITGLVAKELTLIGIFMSLLFFSLIDMEWFFQGTENYKFITIRNVFVKILTLVLIYLFVKTPKDISVYALLLVLGTGGNSLFNFSYILRHFGKAFLQIFHISFLKEAFRQHVRLILVASSMALAGSIYLSLDVILLGNLSTNKQVGFYAASVKIVRVLISVVLALSTVLLPRASQYVKNNNHYEFLRLIELGFSFIMFVSLPCIAGLIVLAEPIMVLFAGVPFYHAYPVMQWLSCLIILASLNNLLGLQILYPLGKEKYFLMAIVVGALFSFITNLFLVPSRGALGAALSALLAEVVIFLQLTYHSRMYLKNLKVKMTYIYLLAAISMTLVILFLKGYVGLYGNMAIILLISSGVVAYFGALCALKESRFLRPMVVFVKNKLRM